MDTSSALVFSFYSFLSGQICKFSQLRLPAELHRPDRAVSLFCDYDLSDSFFLGILIIVIITVNEHHKIRVLLDRS